MTRREYLAKLFCDLGKIIFTALVIGQIIVLKEKGTQLEILVISLVVSIILFLVGYLFVKFKGLFSNL